MKFLKTWDEDKEWFLFRETRNLLKIMVKFQLGKTKPDFNVFGPKITEQLMDFKSGLYSNKLKKHFAIVIKDYICDMIAKASTLNVVQFNGYFGRIYCYTRGIHENHRHLYPCEEPIVARSEDFRRDVNSAQRKKDFQRSKGTLLSWHCDPDTKRCSNRCHASSLSRLRKIFNNCTFWIFDKTRRFDSWRTHSKHQESSEFARKTETPLEINVLGG